MSEETHAAIAARLRDTEGRYTTGRRALVDALLAAGRPVTVEEILAGCDGAGQSSVYRNLALFEERGLVHRVAGHDEFARYELAEDLVGHHHHFACRRCGRVADVELPHELEEALDRALAALGEGGAMTVEAHRIDVVGLCATCTGRGATG